MSQLAHRAEIPHQERQAEKPEARPSVTPRDPFPLPQTRMAACYRLGKLGHGYEVTRPGLSPQGTHDLGGQPAPTQKIPALWPFQRSYGPDWEWPQGQSSIGVFLKAGPCITCRRVWVGVGRGRRERAAVGEEAGYTGKCIFSGLSLGLLTGTLHC